MITNEISIDIINFIYPENIEIGEFRKLWTKYEWENRILINTNIEYKKLFLFFLINTKYFIY